MGDRPRRTGSQVFEQYRPRMARKATHSLFSALFVLVPVAVAVAALFIFPELQDNLPWN